MCGKASKPIHLTHIETKSFFGKLLTQSVLFFHSCNFEVYACVLLLYVGIEQIRILVLLLYVGIEQIQKRVLKIIVPGNSFYFIFCYLASPHRARSPQLREPINVGPYYLPPCQLPLWEEKTPATFVRALTILFHMRTGFESTLR